MNENSILCPLQTLARGQRVDRATMTHADCELSLGNFDYPSTGVGYAGIGSISPPFIVQFLDNGVDLRLKSFEPSVRRFASFRLVRRQFFQLPPKPLYCCR